MGIFTELYEAKYKGGKRRGFRFFWSKKVGDDTHWMGNVPKGYMVGVVEEEEENRYSVYGYIRKRGQYRVFSDEYPFVTKPKLKEYVEKMKKKIEEEMKKHMMGV